MEDFSLLCRIGADAVTQTILDSSIKGTILLALAGVATCLARRASAALRHAIWFIAIAGLLALSI